MSIKNRVEKLEKYAANEKEALTHINYFITGDDAPIGYEVDGQTILRSFGEELDNFRKRCSDLVKPDFSQFNPAMPLDTPRLVFQPIFA